MQHSHSSVELQGAGPTHVPQERTGTKGSGSRGCGRGLYPREGVGFWAWLLLWALVAPGACGLTADMEEVIVELHNFYRGQVFPSATAMMPLKWDASLQVLAGSYVAQCMWQHNPLLSDTGENLFVSEGTLDIQVALEKWFMEHLNYNYDNNSCPEDKMCGHYTQMVWSDSHRVGCEVHSCDVMQGLEIGPSQFLVCNYYPAGNYEDQKPYEEGEWCSRCPEDLQKCENHLCVPDVEEEEDDDDDEDTTILYPHTTAPLTVSFPLSSTEAPPLTPSQDTPPTSGSPPAHTAGDEQKEEEKPKEEDQKEEEKPKEKPKEEEQKEEKPTEKPKEEEQKEEEKPKEEDQKEEEKPKEKPKEEPKQTKVLIETKWKKAREATSSGCRATSCCPYDNFLLLCMVGALVVRL
ncbi:unnamed protein product [Lota lota]